MPAVAELLTVAEVARRLRQSEDTIRRKIAAGDLSAIRLGEHGPLRVPEDALAAHLRPTSSAAPDQHANAADPGLDAAPGAEHLRPSTDARAERVAPVADLRSARALPRQQEVES